MRWRRVIRCVLAAATVVAPTLAFAQGSIAGNVRDSSGAVLPGVTVEASSPALIEKARTAVTDGAGQYAIVDLRPGPYTVTFSLSGFTTVKRDGLVLSAAVTLPVNVVLEVGGLNEVITVTSATPVVDIQRTEQQTVLSSALLETIPRPRSGWATGMLIVGMTSGTVGQSVGNVGGTIGDGSMPNIAIHGGTGNDMTSAVDGIQMTEYSAVGTGERNVIIISDLAVQEYVYDTSAIGAENPSGGVRLNMIPKEGGNRFTPAFFGNFATKGMSSDNLTDRIKNLGLRATDVTTRIWDVNGALGGPIKEDRLWFFATARNWAVNRLVANTFFETEPTRQAENPEHYWSADVRVTWQASMRNKFGLYYDRQDRDVPWWQVGAFSPTIRTPESSIHQDYPDLNLWTGRWSSPVTDRLLLEAAASRERVIEDFSKSPKETLPGAFPILELSTGVLTGRTLATGNGTPFYDPTLHGASMAAVSYVTGSHSLKVGFQHQWGYKKIVRAEHPPTLVFQDGVPFQVRLSARPNVSNPRVNHDLGIYAQERWTIRRLTLNLGLRYDYLNAQLDEQDAPAGTFVPARHFDEIPNLPNWKDISPRVAAAYDLFGNGQTALKVSVNRYVGLEGIRFANANNPMSAAAGANDIRLWFDNGDRIPQPSELGPSTNLAFGLPVFAVRPDPDLADGWGKRGGNWEYSASVQHQIMPGLAANVGYFRRSYVNLLWTDNTLVEKTDYTPFTITSPVDGRPITLYNLKPEKRGQVNNFQKIAEDDEQVFDGIDITVTGRYARGGTINGGVAMGRTRTKFCTTDNPNGPAATVANAATSTSNAHQLFCDVRPPFTAESQYKVIVSQELPWDISASATFQSFPGPRVEANYNITSQLAGVPLTLGSFPVNLMEPGTEYTERLNQLDLRFARTFRAAQGRMQAFLEIFNVANSDTILAQNLTYGPAWRRPTRLLGGRLFKLGTQINF